MKNTIRKLLTVCASSLIMAGFIADVTINTNPTAAQASKYSTKVDKKAVKEYVAEIKKNGKESEALNKHYSTVHKFNFVLTKRINVYYLYWSKINDAHNRIVGQTSLPAGTKIKSYYAGTNGIEWYIFSNKVHNSKRISGTAVLTASNVKPVK